VLAPRFLRRAARHHGARGGVRRGQPLADARLYRVATNSFLSEGGDSYLSFKKGRVVARDKQLSEVLTDYVGAVKTIEPPAMGRLVPA